MFGRKGVVAASRNEQLTRLRPDGASDGQVMNNEQLQNLELQLIEIGAEDIQFEEKHVRVVSDGTKWSAIRDALKAASFEVESAGLEYVPSQAAPVGATEMEAVMKLVDALEEDDDVSTVHTNAVPA